MNTSSCDHSATVATAAALPPAPDTRCCQEHDAFGILHDCHEHILQRLALLDATAAELPTRGLSEHTLAALGDVLAFLHTAIPIHSADEEQTLFPRLRSAAGGPTGHTPMDCMEQEHRAHAEQIAQLERAIVRRDLAAVARAARAIVRDYRSHIEREEEVLYPWARELLAAPDTVTAMTAEMRRRRVQAGMLSC
jgi:hemerythrin-like domain-containing protein